MVSVNSLWIPNLGAIGNCLTDSQFMIGDSTNQIQFRTFMRQVLGNLKEGVHRPVLILDNAGAHWARDNYDLLDHNFNVMFMPPYSCRFNSIEHVWGLLKQMFRRRMEQAVLNISNQAELRAFIVNMIDTIPQQTLDNFTVANRKYLKEILDEIQQEDAAA